MTPKQYWLNVATDCNMTLKSDCTILYLSLDFMIDWALTQKIRYCETLILAMNCIANKKGKVAVSCLHKTENLLTTHSTKQT